MTWLVTLQFTLILQAHKIIMVLHLVHCTLLYLHASQMKWFKLIFRDLRMIFSVVHVDFIVVVQWVTLQLLKDLMWLVGKMMKNKVNIRLLSSPKRKELRPGLLLSIIFLNGYNPSDNTCTVLEKSILQNLQQGCTSQFFSNLFAGI